MANSKKLLNELIGRIQLDESLDEIKSIALLMLESQYGLNWSDVLSGQEITEPTPAFWEMVDRINRSEPVQYVLGKAWFYQREFFVNPAVLIPRPETELLVEEVIRSAPSHPTLLDIGTGSGCIAITLALEIENATVFALDNSEPALHVARGNADRLGATIKFFNLDILHYTPLLTKLDMIVSNPPYIMENERTSMTSSVTEFEPGLALFVPDNDPLLYYREISLRSRELLKSGGKLFFEINALMGENLKELMARAGYVNVSIIQDLDRKDRIMIATLA